MSSKACRPRKLALGLLLAAVLIPLSVQLAWTAPPPQSAADGEAIFQAQCAGCHSIGGGRLVGPDLKGVTAQRDREWLARFIAQPDKVLASGDPIATTLLQEFNNVRMPNLDLSEEQVAALIAYLEAQAGATGGLQPTPVATVALPAGDPDRGKALFLGNIHFQHDGPPCMGCHSIDSAGALGGGVMGPDLTPAFTKYGEAGLAAALANIAFPTMVLIFANHPLTAEEQADLRAYMQAAASQPQVNTELLVLVLSLGGFFVAMVAIGIIWRHRLRGVRRPLVDQAQTGR